MNKNFERIECKYVIVLDNKIIKYINSKTLVSILDTS